MIRIFNLNGFLRIFIRELVKEKVVKNVYNITLRFANVFTKFLAIFLLMPTAEIYGIALGIIYGLFSFCYRFLYLSIGLNSSRKRDILQLYRLRGVIVRLQIYINFCLAVFSFILINKFEDTVWIIALMQFSLTTGIVLAFYNETVRFSAKSLLPKNLLYRADFIRIAIEFLITILFVSAGIVMVNESIFIYFLIGLNLLISTLIFFYFTTDRIFSKPKFDLSYRWILFLCLSGTLFGLDRSIVALVYDDPSTYISLLAISGPIIGMYSYMFVWLFRNSMQRKFRLVIMITAYSFSWLMLYLIILKDLNIFANNQKFSYWISLFLDYGLYVFFYGLAFLFRDFYMQDIFENNKDKALMIIIFPVLAFSILLAISATEILLLLIPITTYVLAERIFSATKYI